MRPKVAPAAGPAPAPDGFKGRCAPVTPRRNESGQGGRTCTCMISVPSGVADCLAPHPDDRNWSSARGSPPAFLHVGQAWSLAHSPTKMAAGAGLAPASRRLTGGRSAIELPGKKVRPASPAQRWPRHGRFRVADATGEGWWAGTDSHRDLLCVGEGSWLLDDPPGKNGARGRTCTG